MSTTVTAPPATHPTTGVRAALEPYGQSRLLTLLVAAVAGLRVGVGPVRFLSTWDSGWFLTIAREGYPHHIPTAAGHVVESALAFFPLFPLLLKIVAVLTPLSDAAAGVAVSLAAGAVAVVVMHRIALRLTGDPARARRAVVRFSFFPGTMVLSMPYSEAVMTALAAVCVLALLEERWWTAGVCAALATASRASALALVPACLWQALVVVRRHRRPGGTAVGGAGPRRLRPLVAPLLAPLGTAAYFAYLWARTGDPLAYVHAEAAWNSGLSFGRPALVMAGRVLRSPFTAAPMPVTATLALGFAVATGIVLARRRWPAVLSVYTYSVLAISVLTRTDGLRPRDVVTAFPLFLAAADVVEERWMRYVMPASAALLALSLTFHNLGAWGQP
jgi:hypothetical protein